MKTNKLLSILLTLAMLVGMLPASAIPARAEAPWDGKTITSQTDWEAFRKAVNDGDTFKDRTVRLAIDINADDAISYSSTEFKGAFDGCGHTITVKLSGGGNCALFRLVNGATIKNLHVAGTISATNKYVGGLISSAKGNVTVSNCICSVVIKSPVKDDGTHGGFIALVDNNATVAITDCLFDGKLLTTNGTYNCGGFVGWSSGTTTIKNCLYAPADIADGETEVLEGDTDEANSSRTFARNYNKTTLNNCYYTRALGKVEGTAVGAESKTETPAKLVAALGSGWEVKDGKAVPVIASKDLADSRIIGIESFYTYTGGEIDLDYYLLAHDFTLLVGGADYTAAITKDGEPVGTVRDRGNYTLTVTAIKGGSDYTGSKSVDFFVKTFPTSIGSAEDWNYFADAVCSGYNYSGETVTLTKDISVTEMVGASQAVSFQGTFDGCAHTLEFSCTAAEEATAPFRYIKGATIKNLAVTGTVTTSNKYAAGIVARSYDDCTVKNCISSITVKSSVSGDGTHGGFVGVNESGKLTITDCLFNGKLLTTNGTHSCGGFVSWSAGTTSLNNCLYAPAELAEDETEVFVGSDTAVKKSNTFARNLSTGINNCYFTRLLGVGQGNHITDMSAETLANNLGSNWETVDGKAVPVLNDNYLSDTEIKGVKAWYLFTGSAITLNYTVTAPDGTKLEKGTHYTESLMLDGETVETVKAAGKYTLTITAVKSGGYIGSKTVEFTVKDILVSIGSAEDWNRFAAAVKGGETYEGQTVTLTKDITVTEMVGSVKHNSDNVADRKSFKGTFDGCGHTLTFNCDYTSEEYIAPFRCIEGATIKNLTVAGTITTADKFAAGIAAHSYGGTIERCVSSVTVSSSVSGDGTHGGFVAVNDSGTLTITDCLFNGELLGSTTHSCGGFVGYAKDTLSITRSLFDPARLGLNDSSSATFARNKSAGDSCFYTKSLGSTSNQGSDASGMTAEELAGKLGSNWCVDDGKTVPVLNGKDIRYATVNGVKALYHATGGAISIDYTRDRAGRH